MKKFLSVALVLCLSLTAFLFVGCTKPNTNIQLEGGPELNQAVTGNGSFSVRKGDYVYFASGYLQTSDLGTGGLNNNHGEVTTGGLYRAKVEIKRTPVENSDSNAEPQYKEEVVLSEVQLLCSKVVGFENSGLYIFGNKIYFSSPSTVKDRNGKVMYSLLTFYSVDLDGQNFTEIYQTEAFSNGTFSFVSINGNIYLLIFDGSKVLKVTMNGNATVLANDVLTVALPKSEIVADNSYAATENEKYVYFTTKSEKTTDTRDFGTVLNKVNIVSGEKSELYKEDYITVTLRKFDNDKIYYTRNKMLSDMSPSSSSYLFINDLSGDTFTASEKQLSKQSAVTSVIEFKYDGAEMDGYVYVNGGKLYFRSNKDGSVKKLSSSANSVLFVQGKYVYYVSSSALYRVDATEDNPSGVKLSDSHTINTTYVDIDASAIYFLVKRSSGNVYDTYYVDIVNFVSGTTKPVKLIK